MVNPQLAPARAQGLRLLTVGVAGPALLWAGYKYPGTFRSRAALAAVAVALMATNYSAFVSAAKSDSTSAG